MTIRLLTLFIFTLLLSVTVSAQGIDSTLDNLQQIPVKYINDIDKKITQYSDRITSKTEKTLTKLSRWENKIKPLLQKASPETAERLFGEGKPTFTTLLQQLKQGEEVLMQYQAPYNKYRDDITTSLKYLAQQKEQLDSGLIKKVKATSDKMEELAEVEDKSEAIQQFIKERKKELISQSIQYIGNSKYLIKINKEAYYYAETLKNYKELFKDSKKAEETARIILNKIPAFQKFMQKNSQLAALFGRPGGAGNSASAVSLAGLQTRASVQSLIQDRISSGGPNAQQAFNQNMQQAQAELNKLKDKILKSTIGDGTGGGELPDFKPNQQKTKTFKQRMEYGFNVQFSRPDNLTPAYTDIAMSAGFKINNKSVAGISVSYKLGMGSIHHIQLSHEGIGLRSFIDWKLKKQFFVSGGYELNHLTQFENINQLKNYDAWQRSALLGLTKKINIKAKHFKSNNISILYDFLNKKHLPVSPPVLFRMGYNF